MISFVIPKYVTIAIETLLKLEHNVMSLCNAAKIYIRSKQNFVKTHL